MPDLLYQSPIDLTDLFSALRRSDDETYLQLVPKDVEEEGEGYDLLYCNFSNFAFVNTLVSLIMILSVIYIGDIDVDVSVDVKELSYYGS